MLTASGPRLLKFCFSKGFQSKFNTTSLSNIIFRDCCRLGRVKRLTGFQVIRRALVTSTVRHCDCHPHSEDITNNNHNCVIMSQASYLTWNSPIKSQLATESSVGFSEVKVDKATGQLFWTETRPDEGGRYVVCSAGSDCGSTVSWTPKSHNARTRVHEYGGGACLVRDGTVYFCDFATQRLFTQSSQDSEPQAVTPADKGWRYADGYFSDKLGKLYYVREDHGIIGSEGHKEAQNTVVVIDPVSQEQKVLTSGADFYSSPRVSPDGSSVAWIQWIHPNMPWDSTELWVAKLNDSGDALIENTATKVAGGNDISVMYPRWTPDNLLLYISDEREWWNLYLMTESGDHVNLRPVECEIGQPGWQFGIDCFDVESNGSGVIATAYNGVLGILNYKTRAYKEISTGFDKHEMLQFGNGGTLYCKALSPSKFASILKVDTQTEQVSVVKMSKASTLDDGYISIPETISWPTGENQVSHGYFYPPKNKDFTAPPGELPPLLVKVHGGPTADTSNGLDLLIQYFTSRGCAILDVNYRGSTGFGKTYRHSLRKNWGVFDVEDCCSGALYLASQKKVDRERLCIDGGSAGGYTTLAALAFKDIFKAGASLYGVADIEILMKETHKFESRYLDTLVCPYTEENLPLIYSRSPIKHIDNFNCPIVFFQGDEDEVVPPNQAEMMFEAVKAKGIPCSFLLFEGEQHGFRKAENIQKCLDGEFYFFAKVFGVEPADKVGEVPIYNLE